MATRIEFARDVLSQGNWAHHVNNYVSLLCWMEAEGTAAQNNPFATTRPEPGATKFNSSSVRNYPTYQLGVKATIETLKNGLYKDIVSNLAKGSVAQDTLTAVENSKWGTHFDKLGSFIDHVRTDWTKYAFKSIPERHV